MPPASSTGDNWRNCPAESALWAYTPEVSSELTPASYLVLGMVRFSGTATPYELKTMAATTVSAFWALPHTQIYTQCDKLVELGLLEESRQTEGRRRRTLTITADGDAELDGWLADDTFVPIEARNLGILKLFFGADPAEIGPTQVSEHLETLAKYEQLKRELPADLPPGVHATLQFGLEYQQWAANFWTRLMESDKN